MKKVFIPFFCLLAFCIGCSGFIKSSDVTAITSGLSFTAEISHSDNTYIYDVTINKNGSTEMKPKNADSTIGTDYLFDGNTVTYKYDNLEYSSKISAIPKSSYADFIYTVLKETAKQKSKVKSKNNQYYLEGKTDKYDFLIYFGGSGLPLKIIDKNKNLSVILKNVVLLE